LSDYLFYNWSLKCSFLFKYPLFVINRPYLPAFNHYVVIVSINIKVKIPTAVVNLPIFLDLVHPAKEIIATNSPKSSYVCIYDE
jgi:hypothetical protein